MMIGQGHSLLSTPLAKHCHVPCVNFDLRFIQFGFAGQWFCAVALHAAGNFAINNAGRTHGFE